MDEAKWMGTKISELSKEQLIAVVEWCGDEILRLRKDRQILYRYADKSKVLMCGEDIPLEVPLKRKETRIDNDIQKLLNEIESKISAIRQIAAREADNVR